MREVFGGVRLKRLGGCRGVLRLLWLLRLQRWGGCCWLERLGWVERLQRLERSDWLLRFKGQCPIRFKGRCPIRFDPVSAGCRAVQVAPWLGSARRWEVALGRMRRGGELPRVLGGCGLCGSGRGGGNCCSDGTRVSVVQLTPLSAEWAGFCLGPGK